MRYPNAEWVPWQFRGANFEQAYWRGVCKPAAVVLHIMAGYEHTARDWATAGYSAASWHFTVARDGHVMQHLEFEDAGYQAGIPASNPNPTWPLWRGHGENVNWYTLGVEHEGFPGEPFTPEQAAASKKLCRWLANELRVPFDHAHFPAHAEIDLINRPNDFNTPELREAHYRYLFEEEDPMEGYRLSLMQIAGGDFNRMAADYDALVSAGLFPNDLGPFPGDGGIGDLNAAEVRRWRLVELAASANAQAAYRALGGS